MGALGAYAQKGVDNGTQFGSGEDSIRCITNISLFVPYAKAGNFKDAYDFWKIVYDECPAATKDIYLHGVKIMAWKIANEKDPAKKAALIDDLMGVYDKRVKYFGDDKRYGKDWIVSRKAQDYIQQMGDKADYNKLYNWLGEIINEYGDNTEALGVSLYMFASYQKMADDPNHKGQYVEDYLKASKILDTQLQAAQAATNTIPILGTSVTEYGVALGLDNFSGTVGGNVSGTSDLAPLDQQADMIVEWMPEVKKVGLLYCSAEANSQYQVDEVQKYLEAKGVTATQYAFSDSNDLSSVCQKAADENDALYVPTDNTVAANTGIVDGICRPAKKPVFAGEEGICSGCGVATLSISYYDLGYTTGEMAVKILNGESDISTMPIEYTDVTKKYNKAICDDLGLTVPEGYVEIEA